MEAPAAAPVSAPAEVVPSVETPTHHDKHEDPANKSALTPPTSEDMDKRDERMSSELSELDSDDGEDIEPDHYWDGGKIPVFKPTMDQFRNFRRFIDKIDKHGMKSGIVKVIPPTEWRDSLPDLTEAVKTIKVKNPITQEFAGQHGIYTQANIEKQRSYNLPEWKAVTEEAHHQPPVKRGERRRAAAEAPSRNRSTRAQTNTTNADGASPAPKRGPGRPRRGRAAKKEEVVDDDDTASIDVPPTPKSPGPEEDKKTSVRKIKEEELDESPVRSRGRQPRGRQPRGDTKKSTASRRMNNRTAMADYVDEAAFEDFDYHLENVSEFSAERCKELEENYWKTVNFGQPMYGADMPGSLFDERTTSWNVAKLPNLLDVLGTKVPGVNTAYLYLGMWKATFAWHLEDVDLYSINYIHFGAPKQWYSISQADARKFEAAMKQIWPNDAKNCSQFLRHKTYLISPEKLEKNFGIKVNRLVHYEGEFVITYPYGYHSGYNIGYNCAESVNFANESWLSYGRIAKKCECESDSVWVDVNEIERKLRGEPTPEYIEETDSEGEDEVDHLPSPPPSVAGKGRSKAGRKPAGNKRKRGNKEPEEAPKPKKVRRIRIRIKVPGRGMPCILCPNDVEYDELLPTDNGMKAHRICADYTPETYILQKNGVETICNVSNIGKDRLELKCNYCRSKRGAVFQCSQKKCTRAFHATCAMAAGVQVDLGPMPTFDEEGTEYYYDGYDFRCRFHRPKKRNNKTVDVDYLEKDKFIMNYAKGLKPKDAIQFQYVGGEMYQIYGGLVVENRPGEQALLVDVLPDGDRVEVEWKYILKLAPEDSQRPKPSANAKPLPDHLKENDASLDISNRTDGVPEMGDPFHDPNSDQKWAEFNTAESVVQKVAKVDVNKPDHLWFYLGKKSTEARPQYTHDLSKCVHNPKSNFLDTVKPPPPAIPHYQYQQRSYPASYPIKPAPVSTYGIPPRTPTPQQQQPKPYQYKPKESMMHTFRAPAYNPDTRKNPNSPVAHQPNVTYDHRAAGSPYGQSAYQQSYHSSRPSQGGYIPYAPPQSYFANAKSTTTSKPPPPPLTGVHHYAQAPPSSALPPNPYQLPPLPYSHSQGPVPRPVYSPPAGRPGSQTQPYHGGAPASQTMSNPTGTSKTPMYATMHSSLSAQPPSSQAEYLAYVTKYPYLKNAFLRRAKTYISPYSPNGGFTPEWAPKVPSASSGPLNMMPPMRPGQPSPGLGLNFGGTTSSSLPMPRPTAQFQSPDAFRQDLNKAPRPLSGAPKWETMLKHLGTTAGQPAPSNATTSHGPLPALAPAPISRPGSDDPPALAPSPISPQPPSTSQQPTKSASPLAIDPALQGHILPLPQPSAVSQPIPSPLGEEPKTPQRPEYSPISDNGETKPTPLAAAPSNAVPPAHTGETWRYS